MKKFLDNLQLPDAKLSSFKAALREVEKYFASPEHQEVLIRNTMVLMGLRNLGVEEVSIRAGKNRSYVGRLLRKDFPRFNPSVETLRAIAKVLGVRPSILVLEDLRMHFQNKIDELENSR